jgi:glycosyltransferase involved in cell wall biosynthesis
LTKGEALESEIRSLGIDVEHVCQEGDSRARKLLRIVQSLRQSPVHILQGVHFYTNLYVAAAARITGSKDIGAIRSNLGFDLQSSGRWGRLQLGTPRHLITNSEPSLKLALTNGIAPERIHLLPNVVTVDSEPKRNGHSNSSVRILFVGRLTEEKRADRFLRVVSKVVKQAPQIKVTATVAGDGPLRPGLGILAQTVGLTDGKLQMVGECDDIQSLYRQSDFLVLTSDMEGTPNVLLEAMAHGLPVLATKVGGIPEIVGADRGLLVEPGDEEGLAQGALRLACEPDLRRALGRCGYDYVSRFHSFQTLPERLLGIYREVLA